MWHLYFKKMTVQGPAEFEGIEYDQDNKPLVILKMQRMNMTEAQIACAFFPLGGGKDTYTISGDYPFDEYRIMVVELWVPNFKAQYKRVDWEKINPTLVKQEEEGAYSATLADKYDNQFFVSVTIAVGEE